MLSDYNGSQPLIDWMCGSGTLLTEAALISRRIAPGLLRKKFGFQNFPDFDPTLFEKIVARAKSAMRRDRVLKIAGCDIDRRQIDAARANGLQNVILACKSFDSFEPPYENGLIVSNPPYGERLKPDDISDLYQRMGDRLKRRYTGFQAWLLTGNPDAAKQIGLRPSKKIKLFNGPIECRLLRFDLYTGSRKSTLSSD
jgi:putative N6-adenine-specific DNA methylase